MQGLLSTPRGRSLSAGTAVVAGIALTAGGLFGTGLPGHGFGHDQGHPGQTQVVKPPQATTPIQHVVVLFDENVSFDHYFGTYPNAANTDGTRFTAAKGTPKANTMAAANLITANPNSYTPQRLDRSSAVTCDQNHGYTAEQNAVNGGAMDKFVQYVNVDACSGLFGEPGLVMDYYDGNTVTAMWNYAQHFAMSDNSWDATFGPSTPGALNVISGQTHGAIAYNPKTGEQVADSYADVDPDAKGVGTVTGDPDPVYDDCSDNDHTSASALVGMQGKNIGDLLNAKGLTWGWFQGGFTPSTTAANSATGYALCDTTHVNVVGGASKDYSPHHNPFAYYKSTSNPHHLPPTSAANVGKTDQANHQYDLSYFEQAATSGNLPAVSYVKAAEYQDGHAAYSDPLDEQDFLIREINLLQQSPQWSSTAVVIAYDDSDGWYDHVAPKISNGGDGSADTTVCSSVKTELGGYADRCGPSQRLPLLVISPYAKTNFIDHTETNQASIVGFIEQNWRLGGIGDASFDKTAGSLNNLFDFSQSEKKLAPQVILNADGSVKSVKAIEADHGNGKGNGHQK
ncbi:phospholipase C [Xylanimonas ulmi]|uniref:Phospholipase C n=1 Tax=Xylanimonas ulmi TaxID=228973 RepID=A0A4Q7M0R8_9MICO|nr:alkaline phosphatase family protein [Xylanibacterium ulmi]RZS60337.1 phospholipase C [Xylanibacterium ulmi]